MTPASRTSWRRFVTSALVLYSALTLLVFRDVFAGETFYGGDVYKYFLPVWIEATSQVRAGVLPVWNPSWSCGAPLLGGLAHSALYPPVVALSWLPPTLGLGLCVALHSPFAALGFACFLRSRGIGARGALVGGAVLGFSGFTLSLSTICPAALYVLSWTGWLLLLLERLLARPGPGRAAALALAGCMVPLAGEPQYALHLLLLLGGWVLLRPPVGPRARGLAWALAAGLVAALLAGVVLVAGLEAMRWGERQSTLGYDYATTWPLLPAQLATLVAPFAYGSNLHDFPNPTSVLTSEGYPYLNTVYVGALPLLAAACAPWLVRRRLTVFFLLAALGFGLTALGSGFGAHRLLYDWLPIYDRFRFPYKAWQGATVGLAGLAAVGVDGLLRARGTPQGRRAVLGAAALAALLLLLVGPANGTVRSAGAALAAGFPPELGALVGRRLLGGLVVVCCSAAFAAFALSSRCPVRFGGAGLAAVAVLELVWSAGPAVATAPVAFQPSSAASSASPSRLRVHMTPHAARYAAMDTRFESLAEFVEWSSGEALAANGARWREWEHFHGSDKAFAPWHEALFVYGERMPGPSRLRLLSACGVERVVSNLPPEAGMVRERAVGGGLHWARLPDAFPRAYWVPEGLPVGAQADAARKLLGGDVDLGRVALIPDDEARQGPTQSGREAAPSEHEAPSLSGPRWSQVPPPCDVTRRTPTEVHLAAPGRAGVVVLLETWFPGWTVNVDGEPRPLLRTNFAFRGVEVGPTDREVVFRYRPLAVRWGVKLTGLGALLWLGLAGLALRRSRNRQASSLNRS